MAVLLFYPATGTVTASVSLKDPSYGDSEILDTNTTIHVSMDKTLYSYKKKVKEQLLITFSDLTKTELDAFITFYLANAGYVLGYTDTLNNNWTVTILNDPIEYITNSGIGDCSLYTITLQLSATVGVASTTDYLVDDEGNHLVDGDGYKLTVLGS